MDSKSEKFLLLGIPELHPKNKIKQLIKTKFFIELFSDNAVI